MLPEFRTYVVANLPGWIVAGILLWAAEGAGVVSAWLGAVLLLAWIAKDVLLFPVMRRFYRSEPAPRRIVGKEGIALTALTPSGFVRVHGEIWKAHAADPAGAPLPKGTAIRVCDIQGLLLTVEPLVRSEEDRRWAE